MTKIPLYQYTREDGGITVSPEKPDKEYIPMVRLLADEGKILTNGKGIYSECIDVDTDYGWYEEDKQETIE